jgi:predicted lipoprotein with Yx(FWY)xxD motif
MNRILVVLPALALLGAAGCGSGPGRAAGPSSPAPSADRAAAGSLQVASTSLGKVLVDRTGRTVYLLTADRPGRSSCDATCLTYWPAVAPTTATPPQEITAPVGRTSTPSGAAIATVGGWPVYTYVQDRAPGDVTGEGVQTFGGTWYAVSPDGQPVKPHGASGPPSGGPSTGATTGSMGPGYGY